MAVVSKQLIVALYLLRNIKSSFGRSNGKLPSSQESFRFGPIIGLNNYLSQILLNLKDLNLHFWVTEQVWQTSYILFLEWLLHWRAPGIDDGTTLST